LKGCFCVLSTKGKGTKKTIDQKQRKEFGTISPPQPRQGGCDLKNGGEERVNGRKVHGDGSVPEGSKRRGGDAGGGGGIIKRKKKRLNRDNSEPEVCRPTSIRKEIGLERRSEEGLEAGSRIRTPGPAREKRDLSTARESKKMEIFKKKRVGDNEKKGTLKGGEIYTGLQFWRKRIRKEAPESAVH